MGAEQSSLRRMGGEADENEAEVSPTNWRALISHEMKRAQPVSLAAPVVEKGEGPEGPFAGSRNFDLGLKK